ncbi:hypothetical protein PFISCL1PPCAC_17942, partial [Pristionchus fissidentatus]
LYCCRCGLTPIPPSLLTSQSIVGGSQATPYSWPWQAVVCKNEWFIFCTFKCAATVIGKKWIMTAADCVDENTQNWSVRTGVFDESEKEGSEQKPKIKKIFIHPDFDRKTKRNNLALIQLENDLKLDTFTQPICLPSKDKGINSNSTGWITGWGFQKIFLIVKFEKNQAEIDFDSNEVCERTWGREIGQSELCAGELGRTPCESDIGDPLVAQSASGKWFQHGAVSITDSKCKLPGYF